MHALIMGRQEIRKNRQTSDTTIFGPSIALLQERFKKLGRMKEKQEQKRQILMMMFSEPQKFLQANYRSSSSSFSSSNKLLHHDVPSRSDSRSQGFDEDPLSLRLALSNKQHAEYGALMKVQPSFSALWSSDNRVVNTNTPQMYKNNYSDVDTSLHL